MGATQKRRLIFDETVGTINSAEYFDKK